MRYIDQAEGLVEVCLAVEDSPWVAVDTEADSLHHYREKLCLVQISIPGEDYVIDPLAGADLGPFVALLSQKPILMHGADFDVRILNRFYGFTPSNVFDTVVGAQLLGYDKQGLADLVLRHCGISLSKSSQTADWSMRPLKPEMLEYAKNDTHYLFDVKEKVAAELASLGRLTWHREFCERVTRNAVTPKENTVADEDRWRIKGSRDLNGRQQTMLKLLWQWREDEARRRDRPSFKVVNAETLVDIVKWAFENKNKDIGLWPAAPRNITGEHRNVVNRILADAWLQPETKFVKTKGIHSGKRLRGDAKERLGELKAEREKFAKELGIQPSLIVSNAVLEEILLEDPRTPEALEGLGLLLPWQIKEFSAAILEILAKK